MEWMKILLVEPMNVPRLIEIDHDLDTMQKLVGGTIACTYPWEDLVGLIHADDGIALGYPPNRMLRDENGEVYDIVPGTFFICGLTSNDSGASPTSWQRSFQSYFATLRCMCGQKTMRSFAPGWAVMSRQSGLCNVH